MSIFDFEKFAKKWKEKYEGNDSILDIISHLEGSWNQGDKKGLKEFSMKLLDTIEETDGNIHFRSTLLDIQKGLHVPPKQKGKKKSGLVNTLRKDLKHGSTGISPNTPSKNEGRNYNEIPPRNEHDKDMILLERYKAELVKINAENDTLTTKLEDCKELLQEREQDIKNLEAETSKLTVERDKAKNSLESCKENLEKCGRKAESEINKFENKIDTLTAEGKQYKDRADTLEAELQKKQKKVPKEYKEGMSKLKDEVERLTRENTRILDLENRVVKKDVQLERYKSTIEEFNREKDELATRLSAVAGARLLHNNPNVADLSDTNRPTKLAEQYSELYDNEWTDAFTSLDGADHGTEEKIINVMLEILSDCFTVCMEKANEQLNYIKSALLFPSKVEIKEIGDKTFTVEQEKAMADLRKQTVDKAHKDLTQTILNRHEDVPSSKEVTKYIQSCTELCWKMAVQTPPVYIDVSDRKGEAFCRDTFKAYTKTGRYIEFMVWPPLFLHEGGSLLNKGVAQGCDVKSRRRDNAKEETLVTDKLHPIRRGGGPKDSEKNNERKRNDEANAENSPKNKESSEDENEEMREGNGKRANSQNRKQKTVKTEKGEERGGDRTEIDGKSSEKKKSPKKKKKKKQ